MNLMPNESMLLEWKGGILILTTHRVRYQVETFGNTEIKSIMLEELASCTLVRSSYIIFLVFAGICFVLGLVIAAFFNSPGETRGGAFLIGLVLAVVFLIIYFTSQHQVLTLASAGTTISVNMKLEAAKQFIERTEAAKNARYLLGR